MTDRPSDQPPESPKRDPIPPANAANGATETGEQAKTQSDTQTPGVQPRRRRRLALHWKIIIGLALGVIAGSGLNLTWGPYLWGALDVGDPGAYLAGQKGAPAGETIPNRPTRSIAWLESSLERAPKDAARPISPPANAYTQRTVAWIVKRLGSPAPAPTGPADPAGGAISPPEGVDPGAARAWLLEEVRLLQRVISASREEGVAARQPTPIAPPDDATLARGVAWLVGDLVLPPDWDPNADAGFPAFVPKQIGLFNKFVGKVFINSLQFIAVPIVLFSLIVGVSSLNDTKKLSRIGGKTIAIYIATTAVAITIGLTLANVIKPGSFVPTEVRDQLAQMGADDAGKRISAAEANKPSSLWDQVANIIPTNPFNALASGNMLQVVMFALAIGLALTLIPDHKSRPVVVVFDALTDVVIKLVNIIMMLAPYAIFALIADVIAQLGVEVLGALLAYALTVIGGLAIMVFAVYPLIIRFGAKMGYKRFFRGIAPAQLLAFSSSSSSATLPVTMECCEQRLGVSDEVTSFVLPVGATINMDGTALYQGVAAVFISQLFVGVAGLEPLTIVQQLTIVLTATLASIGTAGVPSAGIVMLIIILQQLKFPEPVIAGGIAIIFGVDRILDMCRTTCNVTGDCAVCVTVASGENELLTEEEVERRYANIDDPEALDESAASEV